MSPRYITNNRILVNVDNRPVRNLDFRDQESVGKASWYDSFWFWPAKDDTFLELRTESAWNRMALRDGSTMTMHASCKTLSDNDYDLYLNGKKVDKHGFELSASHGGNDTISLTFAHGAPQGKHFVTLTASGHDLYKLETINDVQANAFEHTMRVTYSVVWNPLKWIILLLVLALVVSALAWFLFLKRLFYPTFRIVIVQVNSPYFGSKRVKGKRKLVFANKKVRQSVINRIFTGEIVTEVSPEWADPIELTPYKKDAKIKTGGKYSVDPYALTLRQHNEYKLEHQDTRKKYTITIN